VRLARLSFYLVLLRRRLLLLMWLVVVVVVVVLKARLRLLRMRWMLWCGRGERGVRGGRGGVRSRTALDGIRAEITQLAFEVEPASLSATAVTEEGAILAMQVDLPQVVGLVVVRLAGELGRTVLYAELLSGHATHQMFAIQITPNLTFTQAAVVLRHEHTTLVAAVRSATAAGRRRGVPPARGALRHCGRELHLTRRQGTVQRAGR
jgi:hypothetical protein